MTSCGHFLCLRHQGESGVSGSYSVDCADAAQINRGSVHTASSKGLISLPLITMYAEASASAVTSVLICRSRPAPNRRLVPVTHRRLQAGWRHPRCESLDDSLDSLLSQDVVVAVSIRAHDEPDRESASTASSQRRERARQRAPDLLISTMHSALFKTPRPAFSICRRWNRELKSEERGRVGVDKVHLTDSSQRPIESSSPSAPCRPKRRLSSIRTWRV